MIAAAERVAYCDLDTLPIAYRQKVYERIFKAMLAAAPPANCQLTPEMLLAALRAGDPTGVFCDQGPKSYVVDGIFDLATVAKTLAALREK